MKIAPVTNLVGEDDDLIGILVATHGGFAVGIKSAAEMIIGEQTNFDAIGFAEDEGIEQFKVRAASSLTSLECNEVLVLCDLYGASPYNVMVQNYPSVKERVDYTIICGVNLPMVIEALLEREKYTLADLAVHLQNIGRESLVMQNFSFAKEKRN